MEIFFELIIDICPSGVSSVSCKLELACGVTLCLLDWPTLIIKPHWASESHINLGENWLTTSQGTGWPQSYWYLNNLCIFIATTKHCGQKSGQTNNCFDFHVTSLLDSDRVMIVIVMSLSVSDHFPDVPISSQTLGHKPDTNTKSVTPLWWVSQAVMLVRVSPLQMETLLGRKREKSIWFLSLFYSMGSELVRWQELWTKYHKHISELITSNTFYWYLTLSQATSRSRHLFFQ